MTRFVRTCSTIRSQGAPAAGEKKMRETEFAAFLRGVNVGGNNMIPMEQLKRAFESLQCANVQTVLASGNVTFQASTMATGALEKKIEKMLEARFGKKIGVRVRTLDSLRRMAASQPFKGINPTSQTRLYVTFLPEKPASPPRPSSRFPRGFRILRVTPGEVFSALTLSAEARTVDLMQLLESEFGHGITTRSYNTILRVLKTNGRPGPAV